MEVTVIALHGNGGGGFRFSLLQPDFTLLAPTLPGFEGGVSLPSLSHYADHLHQLVEEVRRPRCVLATGIGGSLLLEYLQHYPDSLDGVVLHAPVGADLDKRWFPRLMSVPGVAPVVKWMISWRPLRPLWKRLFFVAPERVPESFFDRFFAAYGNCAAFVPMFEWLDADWWQSLSPVDIPAALLWGEQERMLKVEQVDQFRELLPQAQVRIVADWDHFPMVEQPDQFCAEVRDLLEGMRL